MLLRHQVGLVVCFLECLLFGGTLFGWPSLVYVFKQDGVYHHLCVEPNQASTPTSLPFTVTEAIDQQWINSSLGGSKDTGTQGSRGRGTATGTSAGNSSYTIINNSSPGLDVDVSHIHDAGTPCPSQDTHLALAVILAVLMQGLAALPSGRLFDKFGLRATRTMGSVFGFLGYNLLAFVHEGDSSWLVYLGCSCIGVAQNIVMMTNCYVSELAGSRGATIVALYNGAMLASSGVLLLVKFGHDSGVPRTTNMTILAALWIITIINTFAFLPKHRLLRPIPIPDPEPGPEPEPAATPYIVSDNQEIDTASREDPSSNYIPAYELSWTRSLLASDLENQQYELEDLEEERKKIEMTRMDIRDDYKTWIGLLKSSMFITHLYWFCILHFRINIFISTFSLWVTSVVKGDTQKESHFIDVYGYLNIAGIILSPIPGLLVDYRRKRLAGSERFGLLGAMAAAPLMTFATGVTLVMGLTSLLMFQGAIYLSIVTCVVLRAFVYPTGTAFISLMWPSRHYGSLFGATFTMMGAVAFLQYPFVIWASGQHRGNISMNAILLLLTVLSFLHPGHVFFKYRKRKENETQTQNAA